MSSGSSEQGEQDSRDDSSREGLGIPDPRSMSGQGGCTIPYDLHVCYVPRHPL